MIPATHAKYLTENSKETGRIIKCIEEHILKATTEGKYEANINLGGWRVSMTKDVRKQIEAHLRQAKYKFDWCGIREQNLMVNWDTRKFRIDG